MPNPSRPTHVSIILTVAQQRLLGEILTELADDSCPMEVWVPSFSDYPVPPATFLNLRSTILNLVSSP